MQPTHETMALAFADGLIYLIRDFKMANFHAAFHPETGGIVYGGLVTQDEEGVIRYGYEVGDAEKSFRSRMVGKPLDRASFVAMFAAACSAWTLIEGDTSLKEDLETLIAENNRETPFRHAIVVNLPPGVPLWRFPQGPWTATAEGILDGKKNLAFKLVTGKQPGVLPTNPPNPQRSGNILEGLRGLLGRNK